MTRFRRTETKARDLARWKRETPLDTKRGVTQGETDRRATAVRPRTGNRQGFNPVQTQRSRDFGTMRTCLAAIQVADEQMGPGPLSVGRTTERLRTVVDRSDRVRLLSLDLLCPFFLFLFFFLFAVFAASGGHRPAFLGISACCTYRTTSTSSERPRSGSGQCGGKRGSVETGRQP